MSVCLCVCVSPKWSAVYYHTLRVTQDPHVVIKQRLSLMCVCVCVCVLLLLLSIVFSDYVMYL